MPRVGYGSTNQVFERAKTIHALNSATTVIGNLYNLHALCIVQVWLTMMRM
jgi:hypothetical protein